MAEYITSIKVGNVNKQIDYNSLANKPASVQAELTETDGSCGQRIKALEELLSTTATSAMLLDNMQTDLESEV